MNRRMTYGLAGIAGLGSVANAAAQGRLQDKFFGTGEEFTDTASAGNGGVGTASANGGAISAGDINSGGNVCNAIGVGDTIGPDPDVYGGDCLNATDMAIAVDGGTSISDTSGGSYNLAFVS